MIKAQRVNRRLRQWNRPDQFPPYSQDDNSHSITVLLYDSEFDMHGIGWYNFHTGKWSTLEEFYLDNPWTWTRLPRPITNSGAGTDEQANKADK